MYQTNSRARPPPRNPSLFYMMTFRFELICSDRL
jgi:hypothetical protein